MLKVPDKIFNIDINDIEVGISEIHIYTKDEIEEAQAGYRYNGVSKEKNEEWIGEEYIVIGNDSCCGDPIIAKIDEEEIKIYSMFNDDWSSLQLIASTFEQFINFLKKIDETNLEDKEECKRLLEQIKTDLPNEAYDYWEGLIVAAYEFLTDEEYV